MLLTQDFPSFREESLHLREHSTGSSQINGQTQTAPGTLLEQSQK